MGTVDTGNFKRNGRVRGARAEKLSMCYYVHCLGDGIHRSPNLSIIQYTLVTNPNLKLKLSEKENMGYEQLQGIRALPYPEDHGRG